MRKRLLFAFMPAFLIGLATPAAAVEIDKSFHESFDVREGFRLRLDHGDGDVTITPWDRDVVDVSVRYRADITRFGLGRSPDFDVEFRQSDDTVHVIGKETGSGFSIGFSSSRRYEYIYEVRAPAYLRLELGGDDGNVRIARWRGPIDCVLEDGELRLEEIVSIRTNLVLEDGDVEIRGLEGELVVKSDDGNVQVSDCKVVRGRFILEDGDLTLSRCEGDFEIRADDGDVALRDVRAGILSIRTEDGDVELSLLDQSGLDVVVETDDGTVDIALEPGTSVTYLIETDDGRIRLNLPEGETRVKRENRVTGEIHGGKGRIQVRAADGDVDLRQSG